MKIAATDKSSTERDIACLTRERTCIYDVYYTVGSTTHHNFNAKENPPFNKIYQMGICSAFAFRFTVLEDKVLVQQIRGKIMTSCTGIYVNSEEIDKGEIDSSGP